MTSACVTWQADQGEGSEGAVRPSYTLTMGVMNSRRKLLTFRREG